MRPLRLLQRWTEHADAGDVEVVHAMIHVDTLCVRTGMQLSPRNVHRALLAVPATRRGSVLHLRLRPRSALVGPVNMTVTFSAPFVEPPVHASNVTVEGRAELPGPRRGEEVRVQLSVRSSGA
eukprot:gene45262-46818_t